MLLALAGCSGDSLPGETGAGSSTTAASVGTTTTTVAPTVTVPLDATLEGQIEALIATTEELRGRVFLTAPRIVVLAPAVLNDRARVAVPAATEADEQFYRFMGLLSSEDDLASLLKATAADPGVAVADLAAGEILVAERDRLSPLEQMTVVHELVRLLIDQHFGYRAALEVLAGADRADEATALRALVAGDAAYMQLLFFESRLSEEDRRTAALEAAARDTASWEALPEFIAADLRFPSEEGFDLVARLVVDGGVPALDAAYADPPRTTEQVLDPDRYLLGEQPRVALLPATALPGYAVEQDGVLGRWGLELLFTGLFPAGEVIQAGDGWGGDHYRLLVADDATAFVYLYQGDSERDAREVTQLFIDHAREVLAAGQGVAEADGLLFDESGPYVFLDRAADRLLVVIASDPADGAVLRALAGIP
jgi:hypothetical protein